MASNTKPAKSKKSYAEAAERYKKGARLVDLAKEYGISRPGMYQHLRKEGITDFRDDRKKMVALEAIDMYNQGMTMTSIARHYGCTVGAISMLFRKHNIATRNKSILPDLESINIAIPDVKKHRHDAFKSFQKDFSEQLLDDCNVLNSFWDDDDDDDTSEIAELLKSL